jgi:hypothetical protein
MVATSGAALIDNPAIAILVELFRARCWSTLHLDEAVAGRPNPHLRAR